MKRIVRFLATKLAILLVLAVGMCVLGVEPGLNEQGLDRNALLVFAGLLGFGSSFISLARLRRLGNALERGRSFAIQVAGERVIVPCNASVCVEYEREGGVEELEFQARWATTRHRAAWSFTATP